MIKKLFKLFEESRNFRLFLVAVNILGTFIGIYYYWGQLVNSPIYQWIFIADCPLYALLFAVTVAFKSKKLSFLTFFGSVKYASWTVFVITAFPEFYFSIDATYYSILLVLHIFMFLQSFLLLPWIKENATEILTVTSWFLLNDVADYFFGTVGNIPTYGFQTILVFSFVSTLFLPFLLLGLINSPLFRFIHNDRKIK
jgi:uncharacterized membrane protein YpjA